MRTWILVRTRELLRLVQPGFAGKVSTEALTSWDLSFAEYIEEHKDSKLVFCWYDRGVGVVFSPADHHGIWAAQCEGTLSKGLVPDHFVTFLEGAMPP